MPFGARPWARPLVPHHAIPHNDEEFARERPMTACLPRCSARSAHRFDGVALVVRVANAGGQSDLS